MDFYLQAGKLALGSRLRRLGEQLMEDAAKIYALYEVPIDPKWFPVFYVLSRQKEASITEIAQAIGHSHPSVSQIVKEMKKKALVVSGKSAKDGRVNVVRLSATGQQLLPQLETQYRDVTQAVEGLLAGAQHDLWKAIEETEFQLDGESFFDRVRAERKARAREQVDIIDYAPKFLDDFQRLNYAWIEKHFAVEASDRDSLEQPEKKILDPGGHIYLACYGGEIVGTCALIAMDDKTYELAKMTVAEGVRGRGIGYSLGQAAIDKARELGASKIFIESNTALKPAIALYKKLGFQKVVGQPSPYARCNIQMELLLE